MNRTEPRRRILIALTESSPLGALWRAALEMLDEPGTEVVAVLLADDRWLRAASLPFTREFSLLGGRVQQFTRQRAEELQRQSVAKVRRSLEQLASAARLEFSLEVLLDTELGRVEQLARGAHSILILPAQLTESPVVHIVERLQGRIVFVETDEDGA